MSGLYLIEEDFLFYNDYLIAPTAAVVNVIYLYAVFGYKNEHWKTYRIFLALNGCVDLAYALIGLAVRQVSHRCSRDKEQTYIVDNQVRLMVATGWVRFLPHSAASLFLLVYCFIIIFSFAVVPCTYVFRYVVLVR